MEDDKYASVHDLFGAGKSAPDTTAKPEPKLSTKDKVGRVLGAVLPGLALAGVVGLVGSFVVLVIVRIWESILS